MAEEHTPLAAPCSAQFYSASARMEILREAMGTLDVNDEKGKVAAEIEVSKVHWSERTTDYLSAVEGPAMESSSSSSKSERMSEEEGSREWHLKVANDNVEVFWSLQENYPGGFFADEDAVKSTGKMIQLVMARLRRSNERLKRFVKFGLSSEKPVAEGGQAEIFYAHSTSDVHNYEAKDESWVMKVFKEGTPLKDLVRIMPPTMLIELVLPLSGGMWKREYCASIDSALLLKPHNRFAFIMRRAWGDLRKLIDRRMLDVDNQSLLFPEKRAIKLLYEIALGMRELHASDIVHRDLKAANVLIYPFRKAHFDDSLLEANTYFCKVADYECSGGVVGTGFWRAPEILLGLKNRDIQQKPEVFSKAADVYSFGMTCYEILSGGTPFEKRRANDYDGVIGGERPILPNHTSPWMRDLVNRCWHHEPSARPSFEDILGIFRPYTKNRTHRYYPGAMSHILYEWKVEETRLQLSRNGTLRLKPPC